MDAGLPDSATIRAAIELAVRAPSIHNTQPWYWRVGDRTVHLYADTGRHLVHADPDQRDLLLSCGIALHHTRVALAALGWQARTTRFPNSADPDHIAAIQLQEHQPTEQDVELAAAIPRRRTDRRYYSSWPVPAGHLGRIVSRAAQEGVVVRKTEASYFIEQAMAFAAASHAVDTDYATELAVWSGRHGSADGVPAASVPDADEAIGFPTRRFAAAGLSQTGGVSPLDDAGELLVLGTPSDDTLSRLRAGEATSAILLTATALGLASCPLTEPLEVATTRAGLRANVLDDNGFPQMIIRVGWAPTNADPLPATPRRSVDEFLRALDETRGQS